MPVDRRQGGNGQRGNYHTVGVVWNSVSKVHIYFGSWKYRQAGNNVSLALGATEMRDNRERARPSTHCKRILRNKCIAMVAMVDLDSPSSP